MLPLISDLVIVTNVSTRGALSTTEPSFGRRTAMKVHASLVLTTGLLLAAGDSRTIGSDKDVENLQGTWIPVSLEADGRKAPQEVIRGFKIFIKANRIIFTPETDKRESTFKLDASKRPKEIVIT